MDHPGSLSPSLAPWRTAALVAATIAAVELLLLIMVGLVVAAKPFTDDAEQAVKRRATGGASAPVTQAETGPASATLSRGETSVLVLNGNGLQGAAATAAGRVRVKGYLIAGTGNATRSNFRRSLVMYRPGYRGEAERLAKDLGVKRVGPLDGLRAAELQGAHAALVVGRS